MGPKPWLILLSFSLLPISFTDSDFIPCLLCHSLANWRNSNHLFKKVVFMSNCRQRLLFVALIVMISRREQSRQRAWVIVSVFSNTATFHEQAPFCEAIQRGPELHTMHGLPPKTVTKGHGPKINKRELESVEAQEASSNSPRSSMVWLNSGSA